MTIVAFYHILIYFTLSSKVFFIFIFYAYAFPHIRMKLSFVNTRLNLFLLIRNTIINNSKEVCIFVGYIQYFNTETDTLCCGVYIFALAYDNSANAYRLCICVIWSERTLIWGLVRCCLKQGSRAEFVTQLKSFDCY